jgi:hypothetical protein
MQATMSPSEMEYEDDQIPGFLEVMNWIELTRTGLR